MIEKAKRLLEWISKKISLESGEAALPQFNEGDIWWCSLGENVGTEIGGKGDYFRRPVVVLTKLDNRSFIGIPLTSKTKSGSWYFPLERLEPSKTVVIAQARYVDCKRLGAHIGTLTNTRLEQLQDAFIRLVTHNRSPAHEERVVVGNPKLDDIIAPTGN